MTKALCGFWLATYLVAPVTSFASAFGGNSLRDVFTVRKIEGKRAVTEGAPEGLKEGDSLYFARSPFKFTVVSVEGSQVTVALPDKSDLKVGQTLIRNPNDQIKKALNTEKRLKQALEE